MAEKNMETNLRGVTVQLKIDTHCGCFGCAAKIMKFVLEVTIDGQILTVVGIVDPAELREKLEHKTRKKVELISPKPKKGGKNKPGGDDSKLETKKKKTKAQGSNDEPKKLKPKKKEARSGGRGDK